MNKNISNKNILIFVNCELIGEGDKSYKINNKYINDYENN